VQNWTISRSKARDGKRWHIQARTDDQLSSFVAVVSDDANILRTKTADGKMDVFTLSDDLTLSTMNVVGVIRYVQDWKGA